MQTLWAETALTCDGWQSEVLIDINKDGFIARVEAGARPTGELLDILLPAPANLHSHAFQRAFAGMSETRSQATDDTFWTWRKLMYRFVNHLTPEDIEVIAQLVQMEMLEAGFSACCEFHYLHHQNDGTPYDNIAELANRIVAAANETGIGLTLLPVLYQHGGCDGRPLRRSQRRFGNDFEQYAKLMEAVKKGIRELPGDANIGAAPHSLRAVDQQSLKAVSCLLPDRPLHIHVAEQQNEIDEVEAAWGSRPVEWLLDNHPVSDRWCFIHATHMQPHESKALAASGVVAGLCPITEANLGDGIFDGKRWFSANGKFGIGSDSNVRISLGEELRMLEYGQRLHHQARAVLASPVASTGRVLFEGAAGGGAQAAGRHSGVIGQGRLADLVALDGTSIDLIGQTGDAILDSFIFAADDHLVRDVWSAGRHVVKNGRHIKHDAITARYRKTIKSLRERI